MTVEIEIKKKTILEMDVNDIRHLIDEYLFYKERIEELESIFDRENIT